MQHPDGHASSHTLCAASAPITRARVPSRVHTAHAPSLPADCRCDTCPFCEGVEYKAPATKRTHVSRPDECEWLGSGGGIFLTSMSKDGALPPHSSSDSATLVGSASSFVLEIRIMKLEKYHEYPVFLLDWPRAITKLGNGATEAPVELTSIHGASVKDVTSEYEVRSRRPFPFARRREGATAVRHCTVERQPFVLP